MEYKLKQDLKKAIRSASLDDSGAWVDKMLSRIDGVIQALDEIKSVDVEGVEPLYIATEHLLLQNIELRADKACDHITPDMATRHAPDKQKGLFLLPKMVD